jgi:triosephosphate isomerase
MPNPLIAGNWKMNGLAADLDQARALADSLAAQPCPVRVALCVPTTLLTRTAQTLAGSVVIVGAQDVHAEAAGAFTGDVSAEMLADAGAKLVIVGHSERRAAYGESDAAVCAKAKAVVCAGLEPIICVGESLAEREAGRALAVVTGQIEGSVDASLGGAPFAVAYEPVWAIGTGLTPTLAQIAEVHAAIRAALVRKLGPAGGAPPILYGGSVKPSNAAEILAAPEVGGALVGGASLKATDFLQIVRAAG